MILCLLQSYAGDFQARTARQGIGKTNRASDVEGFGLDFRERVMSIKKTIKRVPKIVSEFSTYLDPLHCDSTISYKIIDGSRGVWGSIQLADCNRKIEWYFAGNDKTMSKVDRAIESLQKFKVELSTARTVRVKRTRRKVIK